MDVVTFQLVKAQHKKYMKARLETNDTRVLQAVCAMIDETITPHVTAAQREQFFATIDSEQAANWFSAVKEQVTPYDMPTEAALKKHFKREKKLKLPKQLLSDYVVFVSWDDPTQMKRYIVHNERAIVGVLEKKLTKGICAICNEHRDTVLFTVKTKSGADGQYTKNSRYICAQAYECNAAITEEARITQFMIDMQQQAS